MRRPRYLRCARLAWALPSRGSPSMLQGRPPTRHPHQRAAIVGRAIALLKPSFHAHGRIACTPSSSPRTCTTPFHSALLKALGQKETSFALQFALVNGSPRLRTASRHCGSRALAFRSRGFDKQAVTMFKNTFQSGFLSILYSIG